MKEQLQNNSHKRFNILTGEWVLVSPHRNKRPWQGQQDDVEDLKQEAYVSDCYLCPGNTRAGGKENDNYTNTFVFQNDFAALEQNENDFSINDGLLKAISETGICKVICFSPDHSKSLAQMDVLAIEKVIEVWQKEFKALAAHPNINYVQIFENKGAVMGCSNPHPHGQIWAQRSIPNEVIKKDNTQKLHYDTNHSSLLKDYLIQELELRERIIFENKDFVILVPFWAIWPFETIIVPKKCNATINLITDEESKSFAQAIKVITSAYDKVFNCSFPYSSGIHQAPTNLSDQNHWHWHMSFYPPLLRSASIKKFMVGYEMFAMPQRDITAESAAKLLTSIIEIL